MLIPQRFWGGIADGSITTAVRRWKRPTVTAGGNLRSPAGYLAIDAVEQIPDDEVDDALAIRCGYEDLRDLIADLHPPDTDRRLFRIDFHLGGPDPRDDLRRDLDDLERVIEQLAAMDRRSPSPWTSETLRMIRRRPATVSSELADELGRDRAELKRDVAKLKRLGLTISLRAGYELSPRGEATLALLES